MHERFIILFLGLLVLGSPLISESYLYKNELIVDNENLVIRNGNLGIGIANPTQQFHLASGNIGVSGDMIISHPNPSTAGQVRLYDSDVTTANTFLQIQAHSPDAAPRGTLGFVNWLNGTSTIADNFYITPTGSLGLGDRQPITKFTYGGDAMGHAENASGNPTPVAMANWHEAETQDYAKIRYILEGAWTGEDTQLLIEIGNTADDLSGLTTNSLNDAIDFRAGDLTPLVEMRITNQQVSIVGTLGSISDRRLKERINPILDARGKLNQLQGVSFYYDIEKDRSRRQKLKNIGFIAQDVALVFPEAISTAKNRFILHYPALVPVLVEGVKEQSRVISDIDRRLSVLESKR